MGRAFVVVFVLIAATLSLAAGSGFDLDAFDSAELALAAVTAGLGHPPGQPVHAMLGWLATRGPLPPLAALTLLSIVPFALTLALGVRRGIDRAVAITDPDGRVPRAAAIAVFVVGVAPTMSVLVRDACTRVEVYALAAMFAVLGVWLADRNTSRHAFASGLCLGLASAVNPVVAVQGAGAAVVLVASRSMRSTRLRGLALAFAGGAVGLGAYAYAFMVRHRAGVTLVWGAPNDLASFGAMLFARDFQGNVSLAPTTFVPNVMRVAWDWLRHGTLAIVAVGAWTAWRNAQTRSDRWVAVAPSALATLIGIAMVSANVPYRGNNPDYGGYALVPVLLAVPSVVATLIDATNRLARGAALSLVAVSAVAGLPATIAHGRPHGTMRAIASAALDAAPPRALMVLGSDHLLFPVLYLQHAESHRRDVVVLNPGWGSSSWAWQWARAQDPSLVVDLSPGLGPARRLAAVLRSRQPGRAIVAENLALLRLGASGGVCPRGLLWASEEACGHGDSAPIVARALGVLRASASACARDAWDSRVRRFVGRGLGDDALRMSCPGLAARYYAASIGAAAPVWAARACDGRHVEPLAQPPDLLTIESVEIERAIARAEP